MGSDNIILKKSYMHLEKHEIQAIQRSIPVVDVNGMVEEYR